MARRLPLLILGLHAALNNDKTPDSPDINLLSSLQTLSEPVRQFRLS
jgi:hypothetical protein